MAEESGPLTGWELGGWKLGCLLGSGGMGVVYRATRGDEVVAIKVLRAQWAWDQELNARFRREIEIVGRLRSGRIARLVEAQTEGPVPWFATELVEGPTLEARVRDGGRLAGTELYDFAVGLARCVDDLCQAGVVHRDIKPSNVILTDWAPILLDFGVARGRGLGNLTTPGAAVGTPAWMAPEQIVGDPVGPPTDVFAWAATTAYAATGRRPFGTGEFDDVAVRVVRVDPDLEGVDPDLAALLRQVLVRDPQARPPVLDVVHAVSKLVPPEPEPKSVPGLPLAPAETVFADGGRLRVGLGGASGPTYIVEKTGTSRARRGLRATLSRFAPSPPVLVAALLVAALVVIGSLRVAAG